MKILSEESSVAYTPRTTVHLSGGESRKVCVDVCGLSASWSMERDKQVLTDISFKVDQVTSGWRLQGSLDSNSGLVYFARTCAKLFEYCSITHYTNCKIYTEEKYVIPGTLVSGKINPWPSK